jgi:hypothetical protein
MVAQQWKRGLPLNAFHRGLGIAIHAGGLRPLPAQVSQYFIWGLAAVEASFKKVAKLLGFGCHRWRAAKGEAHTLVVQIRGCFGKLAEQAFTGFGRQPVRDADQICFFIFGSLDKTIDGNSWA